MLRSFLGAIQHHLPSCRIAIIPTMVWAAELTSASAQNSQLEIRRNIHTYGQASFSILNSELGVKYAAPSLRGAVTYFPKRSFAIDFGYYAMFGSDNKTSLLSGFDGGVKYFPFLPGTSTHMKVDNITVEGVTYWSPYALIMYRSRALSLGGAQLGYSGIGYGAGATIFAGKLLPINLLDRLIFNIEVTRDNLSLLNSADIEVTNWSLGCGVSL